MQGHLRLYGGREGASTGDMFVPYSNLARSEFYADFLRPLEAYRLCASVVRSRLLTGELVSLSMIRGPTQEGFAESHRQGSSILAPHVQRALAIVDRLTIGERARRIDTAMLERLPAAVFLVNATARILRMTEAAEHFVRDGSHLRVKSNRLVSAQGDDKLAESICQIAKADVAGPLSRLLVLRSNRGAMDRVHVLITTAGMHAPGCAYVIIGPVGVRTGVSLKESLHSVYQLTPAESRLCALLKDGHSLQETAEKLSVRSSTAVSQLKSVFSKTGTSRQSDLMRVLIDLAALAGPSSRLSKKRDDVGG